MKRIRNRKFLKAKRMQYSLLLRVYRRSMQEFFQTASELKDEAEFEARVAAKLASYVETFGWKDCGNELLRQARLAVEEEMDNANK